VQSFTGGTGQALNECGWTDSMACVLERTSCRFNTLELEAAIIETI